MKVYDGGAAAALLYTLFIIMMGGEHAEDMDEKRKEIAQLKADQGIKIVVQNIEATGSTYHVPIDTKNIKLVIDNLQPKPGDKIVFVKARKAPPKIKVAAPKDKVKTQQAAPVVVEDPKPAAKPEKPAEGALQGKELKKIIKAIQKAIPKEPLGVDRK